MSRRAKRTAPPPAGPQRECVSLRDLTDCLLDAYDSVARRAHERFLERGALPGGELEDWLRAERELLLDIPVDIEESEECVYALANVASPTGAGVSIGIEERWLVIVAHPESARAGGGGIVPADISELFHTPEDGPASGRDHASGGQSQEDVAPRRSFSILELPAEVDPARSVAVLSDGVLGIRMPKVARG